MMSLVDQLLGNQSVNKSKEAHKKKGYVKKFRVQRSVRSWRSHMTIADTVYG